jgi:hypothetical protein
MLIQDVHFMFFRWTGPIEQVDCPEAWARVPWGMPSARHNASFYHKRPKHFHFFCQCGIRAFSPASGKAPRERMQHILMAE